MSQSAQEQTTERIRKLPGLDRLFHIAATLVRQRSERLGRWVVPVLLVCVAFGSFSATAYSEQIVKRFKETDESLGNPGQGWMVMQRMPGGEGRFPYSVAYFRLNWEEIEPAEGQFDWRSIDEAIEGWGKRGVRVAFRIMTANAHTKGYYCSPKWLFDAGCRHFEYTEKGNDPTKAGSAITRVEPDYGDPLFLKKHGQAIEALAEHFDGNSGIEFIDIGSYGIWGEWHTEHSQPWPVRKQIIDMYLTGFHKTQLVSMSDDAEALDYALSHGAGVRRDGVGSPWHEANWIGSKKYAGVHGLADQWKQAPVVFEWYGNFDYLQQKGWSFDRAIDFIRTNHATFINDNIGQVPADQLPKLQRLGNVAGYRFVLREVSHADRVAPGKSLDIEMKWSNVGVGKLYHRYPLMLCLIDPKGTIVCREVQAGVDTTGWLPGEVNAKASLKIPMTTKPGAYALGMALIDPATEKPAIRVASDAPQADRLYRLTELTVE